MIKAMNDGHLEGLRCVCHNGSTALKYGLKNTLVKCDKIKSVIIDAKAIVKLLKKTYDAAKLDTKLVSVAPIRFASLHDCLLSVDKNLTDICMYISIYLSQY